MSFILDRCFCPPKLSYGPRPCSRCGKLLSSSVVLYSESLYTWCLFDSEISCWDDCGGFCFFLFLSRISRILSSRYFSSVGDRWNYFYSASFFSSISFVSCCIIEAMAAWMFDPAMLGYILGYWFCVVVSSLLLIRTEFIDVGVSLIYS